MPGGVFPQNINKVAVDDQVLLDLSEDTVARGVLAVGYTAHDKDGLAIEGQLVEQSAKTIIPSASEQTAVNSGRYTTGAVKVAAVPTEEKNITTNGTYTPSSGKFFSKVVVNVSGGGEGKNVQVDDGAAKLTNKTSYTDTGVKITVAKTGTYKCTWFHYAHASSSTYYLTRLYKNGSAVGSPHTCPAYNGTSSWVVTEASITLDAGDTIAIYAKTRSGTSYWTVAGLLVIEEL